MSIAAALVIAFLLIWGLVTPWGLGLDFANFYDIGHKTLLGEFDNLYDPLALIGGKEPLGHMKFLGFPIAGYLYTPLAIFTPHTALFLFKLAGSAAVVTGLGLLYRQWRPVADTPATYLAIFLVAAMLWQPFWTFLRVGGQTTPFVFLLLVITHEKYVRNQMIVAALLLSAAVVLKPVFAPMAILLFLLSGNRFRLTALVVMATLGTASLVIYGWTPHAEFLEKLAMQDNRLLGPWMNSGPFSWISGLLIDPAIYGTDTYLQSWQTAPISALRLIAAGVVCYCGLLHLRGDMPGFARRQVIFLTGVMVIFSLSPVLWAHYLMWLFPIIALLIAGRRQLPTAALFLIAVAVILGLFQSYIFLRQLEEFIGFRTVANAAGFGLVKSLPVFLILTVWVVWRREIGRILCDPA
ncbi:MAG: glycosyltransferase family 87 protein, partial [Albidovulum sp.]